jgi:hypothetical protein
MSGRDGTTEFCKCVLLLAAAITLIGSMSGCITINIYFPAAAAEKAADKIIDDVLGSGKGGADAPAAPAK